GDHRVLHALDQPLARGRLRPRIRVPRLREILDGVPRHAMRFVPGAGVGAREGIDQNPAIAARVPAIVRGGAPGEVAHVSRGEVPDLHTGAWCVVRGCFGASDDCDGAVRGQGPRDARTLFRRVRHLRVLYLGGAAHNEPGGHGEGHVVVAVLEVELAGADVGQGIPGVHVVVDDEPWVPLAQLVQARPDVAHAATAVGRDRGVTGDVYVAAWSGRTRWRLQ